MDGVAGVQALLGRYCWLVDHREWEEWSRCFTPDGVFLTRGVRLSGREEIVGYVRDSLERLRLIRHLCHQPEIELGGDGRSASVRSYFELRAVSRGGTETTGLGAYVDKLAYGNEGWQFAERVAEFDYWVKVGEPWLPAESGDAR